MDHESAAVPPVRQCGSYTYGHDVHYIQARLSSEAPPLAATSIVAIDDDGTITFANGTTRWNHDPQRLRDIVARCGPDAELRSHGVLEVGSYVFTVSESPDPCRPTHAGPLPGESIVDEMLRRGGALRPVSDVRAELDRERGDPDQPAT